MADELDVYRDWLGVKESERPPNYYQLLRIKKFDDDQNRIRRHYRKLNAHVRKYSSGNYAQQSQALLNELARAMLCLTDVHRKAEYDESLGRTKITEGRQLSLDEILINGGELDNERLEKAKHYASATGLSLREALVQQKLAPSETIMEAYAESIGLPFLKLGDITIDEDLLPKLSAVLARSHSVVPVMIEGGELLLASPNPLDLQVEEDLRFRLEMPIRTVLSTTTDVNRVINEHYPREAAGAELASRGAPAESAEPSGLEKVWKRVKKWVEENNRK